MSQYVPHITSNLCMLLISFFVEHLLTVIPVSCSCKARCTAWRDIIIPNIICALLVLLYCKRIIRIGFKSLRVTTEIHRCLEHSFAFKDEPPNSMENQDLISRLPGMDLVPMPLPKRKGEAW